MPMEVSTKDCSSIGDAELADIADFAIARGTGFDLGFLSKQRDEWVLCTEVRRDGQVVGFALYTLERIGGTPCILIGIGATQEGPDERMLLNEILAEQYRKALLAFPDEDVLVGVRVPSYLGYHVFDGLEDIVPRLDHKPSGEERAWARRLAKKFGVESKLDDRTSVVSSGGEVTGLFAYGDLNLGPQGELAPLFAGVDRSKFDSLVVFGWAMAEQLADGSLPPEDF